MADIFNEQLVVKKNTSKDTLKTIICVLALLAIPAIFVILGLTFNFYFIVVSICALFFVVYGAYFLITGAYLEYEYSVTNSNLTVDKVIAKRKRKRIISVDIKKFTSLKKLKDSDFNKKSYKKIFKASITQDGDDVYGAELYSEKLNGECLLLFSPNEKTLEAMKPHLRQSARPKKFN